MSPIAQWQSNKNNSKRVKSTIRKIRKIGDPVLRETSSKVGDIDKSVLGLVSDMLDTLENEGGVGLAAPQIGINKRIIIVRDEDKVDTYINPEIETLEK